MFVYKTQAEITAMTDAEREEYANKKREYESGLITKAKEANELALKTAKEANELALKTAKEENELALKTANDANALALKATNDELAKVSAAVKKAGQMSIVQKEETFGDIVAKAIKDNAERIGDLSPSDGKQALALKEITDANFADGSFASANTDRTRGVYESPFAPVWLRNIFPNTTTKKGSMEYLQIDGSNGAAAIWARGTGAGGIDVDKPTAEPTFTLKTIALSWIAGIARIRREILDDIDYVARTIGNHLLYSRWGIFVAENKMISDYIAANAVPYAGTKTIAVEKVIDAAYGFMLANFIQPTHVLMNNQDYVEYIALNKADGSGEYDLPNSQLSLIDGRLFFGGTLEAVPVPTLPVGTAYVVGAGESEFVYRMTPELKMYEEDRDNIPKNLITFRAEERAAFYTKDVNSLVSVELTETP